MTNVTKVINVRRMMGQTGLVWYNMFVLTFVILSSKVCLTNHPSYVHNLCYVWHMGLKLHTKLDKKVVVVMSENMALLCPTIHKILV